MGKHFINNGKVNLDAIQKLTEAPALFEGGTVEFWRDPHISKYMLETHLSQKNEAASRKTETIEKTVNWIIERIGLQSDDSLLDMGCGPGLYCKRFAEHGLKVTGVDFSQNSINYARKHDNTSEYIHQNYLTLDYEAQFDAITLIYGDFCVLSDDKRDKLLGIVHQALKPGGYFVFDVSTWEHHKNRSTGTSWSVAGSGGFWSPKPYMALEQNFNYAADDVTMTQYIVIEDDGDMKVYRNWYHYYSVETITQVLGKNSFVVKDVYRDLSGTKHNPETEWIGVVAQKQ